MPTKNTLQLFSLTLFVFGSAFLVLHVENNEGQFVHYFFKAKIYYSQYNKIIFPVSFWVYFSLFYVICVLPNKIKKGHGNLLIHSLRYPLFYHLYLLILSHSNEIPGFPSLDLSYSAGYEKVFSATTFVCYYFAGVHIVRRAMISGCRLWELIIPVSAIIPYLYLPSPFIHVFYLIASLGLYGGWQFFNSGKWKIFLKDVIASDYYKIGFIFFLGLFFRLWYANEYATLDLVEYSADGPVYFNSALAFSRGSWGDVNFWHSPYYSLYISAFLILFGETSASIFYSQAFFGAFTPVLIYLISRKLQLKHAAFIAGLLVAASHLCIHYSVVINRAAPLTVIIPLTVYSILHLDEKSGLKIYLLLGFLFGSTFYLGQETLPILALFLIYLARHLWKTSLHFKQVILHASSAALGLVIVFISLNGVYNSHTNQWILLGRSSDSSMASSLWNYNNNTYAKKMVAKGFDPFKSPVKSFDIFQETPLLITQLLLGKVLSEIPDFLLDPGGIYFMPLHLAFESFYSANLQFYIYLFVTLGFAIFITNKKMASQDKNLIIGPILTQIIFCSFILGTFRFRVPITPLNMILLALALDWFFFRGKNLKTNDEYLKQFKVPTLFDPIAFKGAIGLISSAIVVLLSFWAIYDNLFSPTPQTYPQYQLSNWLIPSKEKMLTTQFIGLNQTTFAYYTRQGGNINSGMKIRFNMCIKLIPGSRPYYQLAVDGNLIGKPKKILSGCSMVDEALRLSYDVGMISLFVFVSKDGSIGGLHPVSFSVNNPSNGKETLTMPIASAVALDGELKRYVEQFQLYEGSVKIGRPDLFLSPKIAPY